MNITRWSTMKSDELYSWQPKMEKLYTVSKNKICGSDCQHLVAKFRLKLKKVVKAIRPFRYDLNQIIYYYTVEVMNRFKGLDLVDRVPKELWAELHNIVQEVMTKTIPKKKKCKKATRLSEEALQIADIDSQVPQMSLLELLLLCPIGVRSLCFLVCLFSFVSKYFLFLIFSVVVE